MRLVVLLIVLHLLFVFAGAQKYEGSLPEPKPYGEYMGTNHGQGLDSAVAAHLEWGKETDDWLLRWEIYIKFRDAILSSGLYRKDTIAPQQSTAWQGDKSFLVRLVSYDTIKAKVYNGGGEWLMGLPRNGFTGPISNDTSALKYSTGEPLIFYSAAPKYDTIGPVWRLVSDTSKGWNPACAMEVYEVVEMVPSQYCDKCPPKRTHCYWMGSNKRYLPLAVWSNKIE